MENLQGKTKDELISLISELRKVLKSQEEDIVILEALRQAGVDNWEGCDFAIDLLNEWGYTNLTI